MTKGIGSVAWARATHSVRADGRRLSAHAPQAHIGDPVSKRLSRLPLAPVFQPPWVSANVLAYRFQLFLVSDDAIVVISMPELSLIPGPAFFNDATPPSGGDLVLERGDHESDGVAGGFIGIRSRH